MQVKMRLQVGEILNCVGKINNFNKSLYLKRGKMCFNEENGNNIEIDFIRRLFSPANWT
jgi:hypothetical protein